MARRACRGNFKRCHYDRADGTFAAAGGPARLRYEYRGFGHPQPPETLEAAVDAITVDPADGSRVYAGTTKGQLMVSETQGGTWDTIAEGLPIIHNIAVW